MAERVESDAKDQEEKPNKYAGLKEQYKKARKDLLTAFSSYYCSQRGSIDVFDEVVGKNHCKHDTELATDKYDELTAFLSDLIHTLDAKLQFKPDSDNDNDISAPNCCTQENMIVVTSNADTEEPAAKRICLNNQLPDSNEDAGEEGAVSKISPIGSTT